MDDILTPPERRRPTAEQVAYFQRLLGIPLSVASAENLRALARAEIARLQREDPHGYAAVIRAVRHSKPPRRRTPSGDGRRGTRRRC